MSRAETGGTCACRYPATQTQAAEASRQERNSRRSPTRRGNPLTSTPTNILAKSTYRGNRGDRDPTDIIAKDIIAVSPGRVIALSHREISWGKTGEGVPPTGTPLRRKKPRRYRTTADIEEAGQAAPSGSSGPGQGQRADNRAGLTPEEEGTGAAESTAQR